MTKKKYFDTSLLHLLIIFLFICFNNCTGFSPKEIESLQLSSSAPGNAAPTPTPKQGTQKVFMASGNKGRTIMSCDDGQTWVNNRSDDDSFRCNTPNDPSSDCTHTGTAAINLDSGDGMFFADYGWGAAGSVRMSVDGVNWRTLRSDLWGGGVLYSLGKIFLDWDAWFLSSDLGATWTRVAVPPTAVKDDHSHSYRLGTKFVVIARDNGMAVSWDQGQSWEIPAGYLSAWGTGGVAEGNGVLVSIGSFWDSANSKMFLYSARSTDDGHTWTGRTVDSASQSWGWDQIIFDGQVFHAFSYLGMWTSADGVNWSAPTPIAYSSPVNMWSTYGKIAYERTTGTYVMITGDAYEAQKAARSKDGINWTFLDSSRFHGSHPINAIISGDMAARYCP